MMMMMMVDGGRTDLGEISSSSQQNVSLEIEINKPSLSYPNMK
jgi:hypothetical protein